MAKTSVSACPGSILEGMLGTRMGPERAGMALTSGPGWVRNAVKHSTCDMANLDGTPSDPGWDLEGPRIGPRWGSEQHPPTARNHFPLTSAIIWDDARGLRGTGPPDPTLESASPSPLQGSIWQRNRVKSGNRCRINVESVLKRCQIDPWGGEGEADSRVGAGGVCA